MAAYQELKGYRDLKVYQLAYKLAMDIFNESKSFADGEATETQVWLDFARDCGYDIWKVSAAMSLQQAMKKSARCWGL